MASVPEQVSTIAPAGEASKALAAQWRRLIRAATFIAVLTSPIPFLFFYFQQDWPLGWAIVVTFLLIIAYRGLLDVALRRLIPWPSLFANDEQKLRDEDVVNRRRAWFWSKRWRLVYLIVLFITLCYVAVLLVPGGDHTWWGTATGMVDWVKEQLQNPAIAGYVVILPMLFLVNFLILFGPLMIMGITQIQAFEPGDADWGVKLEDVRGQAEAKEEVRKIVSLWQSGEAFEKAGGKRERGILFLGPPGTGKTMLSKAVATGFNCPFVSIPGSGFAQSFIGMDAVIVRYLAWKAKKLARKWGGQCIVFIDEIDAVGMRRQSLGPAGHATPLPATRFEELAFYGPNGSLTPSGDLILETRAWRDRLFEVRAPQRKATFLGRIVNQMPMPGMGGQGQLALNQLLVVMDGIGNPPYMKKMRRNWLNTFLDATYVFPRRIGRVSLRLPRARPRNEQIYFIGACNVPIDSLDPALTRPGRLGRHVWFRTPTKQDRLDIFDLYIDKVSHSEALDEQRRRDEIARVTNGYSPAMIEQVCSMALTIAHHDGRPEFDFEDLFEAMTTVESGTAINVEYVPDETRAVAIHEAGHAVASHVYMKDVESTRLSIRMRGQSLGHHQALEKEERFSKWRSEQMAALVWTLGAMAAERVFYDENSTGVGGDVQSATARAAFMVGASAMGPEHVELNGGSDDEATSEARAKIMKRFEEIGIQIMNRTNGGPFAHDATSAALNDHDKRKAAAQILGQAYVKAYNLVRQNKDAVSKIADVVVARREIYGDELLDLLRSANLTEPTIDYTEEAVWPKL
ncbi:MAG TPA: AAA family ATPase [Gaiellaceae bacterium]|nr:AAA family ATPase [Gaiellaceae bacterium]